MPDGKPAGVRCVQLTEDNLCRVFGQPGRPPVCAQLRPSPEMCGATDAEAMAYLVKLERLTSRAARRDERADAGAQRDRP
jgi:hypothetical protein